MVGARTFPGNPYDGHVLNQQLEQTAILLEDTGRAPKQVVVDLGYRGVDKDNPGVEIIHRGKYKSLTKQQRRWLKRRQAVEPAIGHLKTEGKILAQTPVFMDSPMGNKATEIYKNYPELLNGHVQSELKAGNAFDFPGISYKFIEQSGAKVIIAGSGMMTGGRILKHAEHYLPMAATRLLIVGYQGEGTTGRELLEGKRKVVIEGREVVVAAIISETKAMSSHPDQGQLLTWLKHIRGVKKVFLIHGEDGPREILAKKISEDLGIGDVVRPKLNQETS